MSTLYNRPRAGACRQAARQALSTHWGSAVGTTLLAGLLGAFSGGIYGWESIGTANIEPDLIRGSAWISALYTRLAAWLSRLPYPLTLPAWESLTASHLQHVLNLLLIGALCSASLSLIWFLIGENTRVGLCRYRLALIDGDKASVGLLFSGFGSIFWKALWLRVLRAIRVFLWSLLLLIPGIIASYRYALADHILAENPAMSAGEALRESGHLMRGNKWRLFCLRLSFLGWHLLAWLSGGIGYLWILPYLLQSETVFYHEVSGRAAIREAVLDMKAVSADL